MFTKIHTRAQATDQAQTNSANNPHVRIHHSQNANARRALHHVRPSTPEKASTADNQQLTSARRIKDVEQTQNSQLKDGSSNVTVTVPSTSDAATTSRFEISEDTKISKLIRKLNQENIDQESFKAHCRKLLEVIILPYNETYVCCSFDILVSLLMDAFLNESLSIECKYELARIFGRIAFVMRNCYPRFLNWLNSVYNENYDYSIYLIASLKELFLVNEYGQSELIEDIVAPTMKRLLKILECTGDSEIFIAVVEVSLVANEHFGSKFATMFFDIIDLIIGWHVSRNQPEYIQEFASKSLQSFGNFWKNNLEFFMSLITIMIEDLEIKFFQELNLEEFRVFLRTFNTLMKCFPFPIDGSMPWEQNFLFQCLMKMLKIVDELYLPNESKNGEGDCGIAGNDNGSHAQSLRANEGLLITLNEAFFLILENFQLKSISVKDKLLIFVKAQFNMMEQFHENTVVSAILMTSMVCKALSTMLPVDCVEGLIGPQSAVFKKRFLSDRIRSAVVFLYSTLLDFKKNVTVLHEVYMLILSELEVVYCKYVGQVTLLPDDRTTANPFENVNYGGCHDFEQVVLFLLECVSQLANTGNSIIGMWALKPSIIKVLSTCLAAFASPTALPTYHKVPVVHYAVLELLFSHAKCNGYFISTSNLLTSEQTPNSTTANNLHMLFSAIFIIFESDNTINMINVLLLNCIMDLLNSLKAHFVTLFEISEWTELLRHIITVGHTINQDIALLVCDCLKIVLKSCSINYEKSFVKKYIMNEINELCHLQICSSNDTLKDAYTGLLMFVPTGAVFAFLSNPTAASKAKLQHKTNNQFTYNYSNIIFQKNCLKKRSDDRNVDGRISNGQFDEFLKLLLNRDKHALTKSVNERLLNIFLSDRFESSLSSNLSDLASNSRSFLNFWFTWEAALMTVNRKLKTHFGKAKETFSAIENCLRAYENDIEKRTFDRDHDQLLLLLSFLENLEKLLYNATEGSAVALDPLEKSVCVFFTNNANTCREWLLRIRLMIIKLAIYCGSSAVALRHAEFLLQDLLKNSILLKNSSTTASAGNGLTSAGIMMTDQSALNEKIFETVFLMAVAYFHLNEPSALMGLYYWTKNTFKVNNGTYLAILSKISSNNFESAYEMFVNYVKKLQKNLPLSLENSFMLSKNIDCLMSVHNWPELSKLQSEFESYAAEANEQCYFLNDIDLKKGQQMLDLENGILKNDLQTWSVSDSVAKYANNWNVEEAKSSLENDLFRISVQFGYSKEKVSLLKKLTSKGVVDDRIQKSFLYTPLNCCEDYLILQRVHKKLCDLELDENNDVFSGNSTTSHLFDNRNDPLVDGVKSSTQCLSRLFYWKQLFNENISSSFNLRLNLIKSARKKHNYVFAEKLIVDFFRSSFGVSSNSASLKEIVENLSEVKSKNKLVWSSYEHYEMLYETGKLLYETQNYHAAINLASTSFIKIHQQFHQNALKIVKNDRTQSICSRFVLKIAKWLQNHDISVLSSDSNLFHLIPNLNIDPKALASVSSTEIAIGKLLNFNVDFNPKYSKVWSRYGSWCYKWGCRLVSTTTCSPRTTDSFNDSTLQNIRSVLDGHYIQIADEKIQEIANVICFKKMGVAGVAATFTLNENPCDLNGIGDYLNNSTISNSNPDNLSGQLEAFKFLKEKPDSIRDLIELSKKIQKNVYCCLEMSALSYFNYLNACPLKELNGSHDVLIAALRLLRLMVRHALELQVVLDTGLAKTPTKPWKAIIPQLFARLNHPEIYIRKRVSDLVCRIADTDPHLVLFPVVVGALDDAAKIELAIDDTEGIIKKQDTSKDMLLSSGFQNIVETLEKQYPELVLEVKKLVHELRRISLLWDELWISTLQHHYPEFQNRINKLEVELKKVQSNQNLTDAEKTEIIAEKHRIIMRPAIFVLEQLKSLTFVEPETINERVFQSTFKELINETLQKLKNPPHPEKPAQSLLVFNVLFSKLKQKSKHHKMHTLKMREISPYLDSLTNTRITMPGSSKSSVTITGVDSSVTILPTKTQPKKIMFRGSDGFKYYYLLKGLEDLHLDERIMQFLSIANTMMANNSSTDAHYKARYYSVIPLGPRSGLISWVDGTIPLFTLYKNWQKRQNEKLVASANSMTTKPMSSENEVFYFAEDASKPNIIRHSELFYRKLNPLLEKHGIKNLENRHEWPTGILKQVLVELMNETPKDLLSKEIWLRSSDCGAWWKMVKNYSYSLAVMSIIGYVIGLGDRHLDNVLIDLSNGEVVHIDYNVCFEKGKKLRIPEKVPFRMTANLKHALGITGVEGIFRSACEHTLSVLRNGSETLLTLLEAFIYDPLVYWTVDAELLTTDSTVKKSKKEMDKEVTCAMFNVRCAEIRADWFANKNEMVESLNDCKTNTMNWAEECKKTIKLEEELQDLHEQLALVKEAESKSKHKLFSLPTRFLDFRRNVVPDKPAVEVIKEKCELFEQQLSGYKSTMSKLNSQQCSMFIRSIENVLQENRYEPVAKKYQKEKGYLKGIKTKLEQCALLEAELESTMKGQATIITSILNYISKYSQITSLYPKMQIENNGDHRLAFYLKLFENITNDCGIGSSDVGTGASISSDDDDGKTVCGVDKYLSEIRNRINQKKAHDSGRVVTVVQFMAELHSNLDELQKSLQTISDVQKREGFNDDNGDGGDDDKDTSYSMYEKSYADARRTLDNFIRSTVSGGGSGNHEDDRSVVVVGPGDHRSTRKAFELVMILSICSLNKKIIRMEMTASSSGNCLVDLKTKEGSWFFADMLFANNMLAETAQFLEANMDENSSKSAGSGGDADIDSDTAHRNDVHFLFTCIRFVNNVYRSLNNLNDNFQKIILPETLKVIKTQTDSILLIIQEIKNFLFCPIDDLLVQMEKHLHLTIMEMDSPYAKCQEAVSKIGEDYRALLQKHNDCQSSAEMLFIGLNGLFRSLQDEFQKMVGIIKEVKTPNSWKQIDQFKEIESFMSSILLNDEVRQIMNEIFLVKRIKAIVEFFAICETICVKLKSQNEIDGLVYVTEEEFSKPIKNYIADFVSKQMFGISPFITAKLVGTLLECAGHGSIFQEIEHRDSVRLDNNWISFEDLCKKAIDAAIKQNQFSNNVLTQAYSCCSNFETTWKRKEMSIVLSKSKEMVGRRLKRLESYLQSYYWLFEDYLIVHSDVYQKTPTKLTNFIGDLKYVTDLVNKNQAAINSLSVTLAKTLEKMESEKASGSGGGIPIATSTAAKTAFERNRNQIASFDHILLTLNKICNDIIVYETFRIDTKESQNLDQEIIDVLESLRKLSRKDDDADSKISRVEEKLMMLLPTETVEKNWLRKATEILSSLITTKNQQIHATNDGVFLHQQKLVVSTRKLNDCLSVHQTLMCDVYDLLKAMSKSAEDVAVQSIFNQYLNAYHEFISNLSQIIPQLFKLVLKKNEIDDLLRKFDVITSQIGYVYDTLLELEGGFYVNRNMSSNTNGNMTANTYSNGNKHSDQQNDRETKRFSQRKVQEQNSYAISVWNRVKLKLEGRDPDPGIRSFVADQVSYVIREATNLDNLALLYEGWTPWV